MKKILSVLVIAVTFFSCSNNTSSPSNTVNAFFNTMKKGDMNEFKTLVTKSDVQLIEMAEKFAKAFGVNDKDSAMDKMKAEMMEKAKDISFTIKDEKIEGDKATVNVEVKDKDKTETRPFSLLKEEGKWKISLLSTGMGMSGKSNSPEDVKMAADSLTNLLKDVNADSLMGKMKNAFEEIGKNKGKLEEMSKELEKAAKEFEKSQQK
jgi:ketosteroid isomerase-like protein